MKNCVEGRPWAAGERWTDRRLCIMWIYTLVDPRTMKVKYLGRTNNLTRRMYGHSSTGASTRVRAWVEELKREGVTPLLVPVWAVAPGDDARAAEEAWLRYFRARRESLLNWLSL